MNGLIPRPPNGWGRDAAIIKRAGLAWLAIAARRAIVLPLLFLITDFVSKESVRAIDALNAHVRPSCVAAGWLDRFDARRSLSCPRPVGGVRMVVLIASAWLI
jgi:hypothetical protein